MTDGTWLETALEPYAASCGLGFALQTPHGSRPCAIRALGGAGCLSLSVAEQKERRVTALCHRTPCRLSGLGNSSAPLRFWALLTHSKVPPSGSVVPYNKMHRKNRMSSSIMRDASPISIPAVPPPRLIPPPTPPGVCFQQMGIAGSAPYSGETMTPKTRKLLCMGLPLAALVVVVALAVLARTFLLTHPPAGPVVLHCWDGEKAITVTLPDDEARRVRSISTGELKYPEAYACGFHRRFPWRSGAAPIACPGTASPLCVWDGEDIEGIFVDLSQRDFDWLAALIERHGGVYR